MLKKLTLLTYLIILSVGSTLSLAGVITPEVAKEFQVDTYKIGYVFTLFTIGYSVAIFLNGYILDKVDIKKELICGLLGMLLSIVGATSIISLPVFALFMFFYGVNVGVLYSIAYYSIATLYQGNQRSSKLSYISFCYSLGSLIAPFLAGLALRQQIKWESIYLSTIWLIVILLLFAYRLDFNYLKVGEKRDFENNQRWNTRVFMIATAIFCYISSESAISYWIVSYANVIVGLDLGAASFTLSIFWTFVAIGRLLSGIITKVIAVNHYILMISFSGILTLSAFLVWGDRFEYVYLLIAMVGMSFSSMFALLVSYGIMQVNHVSSKLMSFYMAAGAVGSIWGIFFSSYIKQSYGLQPVMFACIVGLAIVHCLMWIMTCTTQPNKKDV